MSPCQGSVLTLHDPSQSRPPLSHHPEFQKETQRFCLQFYHPSVRPLTITGFLPIVLKFDVSFKSLSVCRFFLSFSLQFVIEGPSHLLEEFPLVLDFADCTLFVQFSQFLCISCKLAAEWKGLLRSGFSAFGKTMGGGGFFQQVNVWLSLFP